MQKETTRPLLVEALERAQKEEEVALSVVRTLEQSAVSWSTAGEIQEAWQLARLHRAVAELQLWLADRQWEREEAERIILEAPPGEAILLPDSLNASWTIKP